MKKLIKHILNEDYSRRKLDMIKKYVETYTNNTKGLKDKVCEVLVQNDGDFLVVDIFIDDDSYKLLTDYEVFDLRMSITSRIIDTFSIKRRNIIAVYVERCSSVRYRYLDQNNDEVKEPIQLKEETKVQSKLISIIKNEGFKIASDSVGGIRNLFKILNKDKKFTIQYLLSYFDDLKLEKFRNEFHLSQSYNTFLEKVPTFKGSYIRVFDNYFYHFLDVIPFELYLLYREDLLREIISRYPELNDVNQVVIYKDRSLYNRLYTFFLNDNDNENTITESTSRKDISIDNIKQILREESFIPSAIKRRISPEDIEEAFELALDQNAGSMNNPMSIIFKEKEHTTLWLFAKFVIDDMVTHIEQESFNDDNRVYFSDNEEDDEYYHEKIRKPLLRHYGKRIKEKYNEVKSGDINESRFIQETIQKFYNKEDKPRGKYSDRLEKMTTDFIGKDKICDIFALYSNKTYLVMVLYNGSSNNYLDEELQNFLKTIVPVSLFTLITDTNCKED